MKNITRIIVAAAASPTRTRAARNVKNACLQLLALAPLPAVAVITWIHRKPSSQKQLRDTGVSVVRKGDISLVMPCNITFDTNSGNLKSSFYEALNSVAIAEDMRKPLSLLPAIQTAQALATTISSFQKSAPSQSKLSEVAQYC